jgi:hypothetical protein
MGGTIFAVAMVLGVSNHQPSYVEQKSAQVFASFLSFNAQRSVEEDQNRLQSARERDTLLLTGGAPSMQSGAIGAMMMGAAVVVAAHMPERARVFVDGAVHFGPALFEGGGMGAGIGGRF